MEKIIYENESIDLAVWETERGYEVKHAGIIMLATLDRSYALIFAKGFESGFKNKPAEITEETPITIVETPAEVITETPEETVTISE